jgi:hypothetical protein
MDTLLAQDGPDGFAAAWLRAHHFSEEATYVETHQRRHAAWTATPTHA